MNEVHVVNKLNNIMQKTNDINKILGAFKAKFNIMKSNKEVVLTKDLDYELERKKYIINSLHKAKNNF